MGDIVTIVLKMTLGMFVNKAKSSLSDKLKDGGLNSQQLRSLIMSNLDDIKSKLVGLFRGNLLSSASLIQEGLRLLNDLLDRPNSPKPLVQNKVKASSSGTDLLLDVDQLVKAIHEIKTRSGDHFTSAMELLKSANTKATEAFHNQALSVEDRVLAAKLRVQSRLLLSLENPSLAWQPCRFYLEELHGVPTIVEVFRNDVEGGMLSFLKREKRHELVLSVSAMNFVVLNFLKNFTKIPVNLCDWPTLQSSDWTYNPLIPSKQICAELQSAGIECPNLAVVKAFGRCPDWRNVAVKSNRDLIGGCREPDSNVVVFNEFTTDGIKRSAIYGHGITSVHLLFLAVDIDDNIYVLSDQNCTGLGSISLVPQDGLLSVFDSKEELAEQIKIGHCWRNNIVAPSLDGFALMTYNAHLCINAEVTFYKRIEGKIQRTFSFQIKLSEHSLIAVTNKYQVVAVKQSGYLVRIFGEKHGKLIRKFELYGRERESCVSITFNFLTEELVFVSIVGSCYFLSTYELETGKRRQNVRLPLFNDEKDVHLTTHCSGPMALVSSNYVLYLQ